MIEGLTYLGSQSKADIQSIGLVFEPNFFTGYFYADLEAKAPVAYKVFDSSVPLQSQDIKSLKPVFALSFNGEYTLVPQQIFKDEDAGTYLKFNTSSAEQEAEWNRIIGLDIVLIYTRDQKAENIMERVFPGLRVKHGTGALLEFCRQTENAENVIYFHQSGEIFNLIIFKKGKLIFANSVHAVHLEDARYFILYALRQLDIASGSKINLLGTAAQNNGLIVLLKPYLPNLSTTINHHDKKTIPSLPDATFAAEHWAGIYASICAL